MFTTRQRITLVNTVLIPTISNAMNFFKMSETDTREIDKTLTRMVKQFAGMASNMATMKIKDKGWGLTAINHINKIQIVNNIACTQET
jgi:hypothetical protein